MLTLLQRLCTLKIFFFSFTDFLDCLSTFFKTLHTISTTTHPISKTLQILCIIQHSCKNYKLLLKKHNLLPYETHTFHITKLCLHELQSAVINISGYVQYVTLVP